MNFKSLLHYLNRRDHHLLPQKSISTKIFLILFICIVATFSLKNILAVGTETTGLNEETGRYESVETILNPYNSETVKVYDEEEDNLDDTKINQQVWIKSSAITNGILIKQIGLGTSKLSTIAAGGSNSIGGLIGVTNKTIASLYNQPASGVEYIASSINNFLGKPVYATNDGFNQLRGIQSLWKICRNAVYTIISIVFVAMGLMIMLRIKISPQATVTIQNSIPKIITTLILVTFSYAICGLIIDLTYLFQALILSIILQANTPTTTKVFANIPGISTLIKGEFGTYRDLMWNTFFSSATTWTDIVLGGLGGTAGALIGAFSLAGGWHGAIIGFVVGLALLVIFIFIQLLKFLIGCAKAYILLIIKIISGPLEIALGAFPNSKMGFSSWFIQTIAYASVFPISLIFLVVLLLITNAVVYNDVWTPGVLQGGLISPFIGGILAIAGLSILAKLPDLIPEAIFKIKPSPFGKAAGENIFTSTGRAALQGISLEVGRNIASLPSSINGPNTALRRAERLRRRDEKTARSLTPGAKLGGKGGNPYPIKVDTGNNDGKTPEDINELE